MKKQRSREMIVRCLGQQNQEAPDPEVTLRRQMTWHFLQVLIASSWLRMLPLSCTSTGSDRAIEHITLRVWMSRNTEMLRSGSLSAEMC